jgi:ORF6N domain
MVRRRIGIKFDLTLFTLYLLCDPIYSAIYSAGFMFQLDEEEFANLRLQIATSSLKGSHGGRRYAPMAFTEHGAIMASMVLNSPRATELSIYVVQAFVELRSMLATNRELSNKLHLLERKVTKHDQAIGELIDSMRQLLAAPEPHKRPIGFVHPQDANKPKGKVLKAGTAKKTSVVRVARKK